VVILFVLEQFRREQPVDLAVTLLGFLTPRTILGWVLLLLLGLVVVLPLTADGKQHQ
jgi:hypothetical protein